VADRIAVPYLGRLVGTYPAAEINPRIVVELMTSGRSGRLGEQVSPGERARR
jgi:hypothetical protein